MFDLSGELTFPDTTAFADEQLDSATRSAEAGDVGAMTTVGLVMCARDDFGDGAVWFTRAAEAGSSISMFWMGLISMRADDFVAARTWFEAANNAGDTRAHDMILRLPMMMVSDDPEATCTAAQAGDPDAMYKHGRDLSVDGHRDESFDWVRKAAEAGQVDAMSEVGAQLLDTDQRTGLAWLEKAASAGHIRAANLLGGHFIKARVHGRARVWLEKSAAVGSGEAMYLLSASYLASGDTEKGRRWMTASADAGYERAQQLLKEKGYPRP